MILGIPIGEWIGMGISALGIVLFGKWILAPEQQEKEA